jgi:uncharacterized protein
MPPLIVVTANDIDIPGIALDATLPQAWLDSELAEAEAQANAPGRLTARLSRSGTEIVVRGRVVASLQLPCARCLQPASAEVDTELSLLLKPAPELRAAGAAAAARSPQKSRRVRAAEAAEAAEATAETARNAKKKDQEYEFSADEADVDTFDGEVVVLDGFVREAILLELPSFPLCSDACPGIEATRAAIAAEAPPPPSVDPRLAPLRALRDKLAENGSGESADGTAAPRPPSTSAAKAAPRKKPVLAASHSRATKKKPKAKAQKKA